MIKKSLISIFVLAAMVFFGYLLLPNPDFPKPPSDSIQSQEPADTEIPLRRAYFTNLTRQEVLDWYKNQFVSSAFLGIKLPTYLLNYPPEDAQSIIRDQTRSTFLEEIIHPFRESIYVNGFEPGANDTKDAINIEGSHWRQKIIIRFIPSSVLARILVFIGIFVSTAFLFIAWKKTLSDIIKICKNF